LLVKLAFESFFCLFSWEITEVTRPLAFDLLVGLCFAMIKLNIKEQYAA